MGAPKIDLKARLWDFFIKHGIRSKSRSVSDYEYGKSIFYQAYQEFDCDYDTYIKTLIDYLEI